MKKLIILGILLMTILSCTAENRAAWERVERERKERGYGCYKDPYYGDTHCGYKR